MLCSLSPHIRAWWGNPPMFPSTSVGWSGLSCFSLAICGPDAHGCREGSIIRTAQTTSKSNSCSTAPSSPWSCPGAALWKLWRAEAVRAPTHAHSVCGPRRRFAGARAICKPDQCNFVYYIGQCCTILAICTIYKYSVNMYNMYNKNFNVVHKIECNFEQYSEQYCVQFGTILPNILCTILTNILYNIKY